MARPRKEIGQAYEDWFADLNDQQREQVLNTMMALDRFKKRQRGPAPAKRDEGLLFEEEAK